MKYIKICGIRNLLDAKYSIRCGANAIGVIVGAVHKTEDEIDITDAELIFKNFYSSDIYKVLVTHEENPDKIIEFTHKTRCNAVQLHSYIPVKDIKKLKSKFSGTLIGLVHGNDNNMQERVKELVMSKTVDMIIVDTKTNDRVGGTGLTHDWFLTSSVVKKYPDMKFILAGGLTPYNVAEAIRIVNPYGVDVNSGVKKADGHKDYCKINSFVKAAKDFMLATSPFQP